MEEIRGGESGRLKLEWKTGENRGEGTGSAMAWNGAADAKNARC